MQSSRLGWAPLMLAGAALACGGVAKGGKGESQEQQPSGGQPSGGQRSNVEASPGTPLNQGGTSTGSGGGVTQAGGSPPGSLSGGFAGGPPGFASSGSGPVGQDADCTSPVTMALAPFVARDPENLSVDEQLMQARQALIGSWHGIVETPWNEPYQIVAGFNWEGGYTARCEDHSDFGTPNPGCCRAFYYGSDRNSPFKHWTLNAVNADHTVDGDIDIVFCDGDESCRVAWQGKLRRLDYDQTKERVRFQFWSDQGNGPVEIELERD